MDIILSKEGVDLQECHVLVTGFFRDERPLAGSTGLIDWRLNGMLSRLLTEKKLTGGWKETTLIPSQGRVMPRMILLLGLGEVREYSYLRVRELSAHLLETLKKLDALDVCLSLPYEERYNVDCGKLAEVLIEGIADCLDLCGYSFNGEWIKRLRLFFAGGEENFLEILLGLQTAKSILEQRIQIRIFTPSEETSSLLPGGTTA
jgi:Cytosol aminopeptidase family, N-terminal domain